MYCLEGLACAYFDHSRELEAYERRSEVRCGRFAVGVWARELAIESRRLLNDELESGGWAFGCEVFVWKSELEIRWLSCTRDAI